MEGGGDGCRGEEGDGGTTRWRGEFGGKETRALNGGNAHLTRTFIGQPAPLTVHTIRLHTRILPYTAHTYLARAFLLEGPRKCRQGFFAGIFADFNFFVAFFAGIFADFNFFADFFAGICVCVVPL